MRAPVRTDWDDLRLILDLIEERTLSAVARREGVDQTTASRRLARLEDRVGEALFDRVDRRHRPRPLALALVEDLAAMAATARRIEARLADARLRLTGTVTVSAVDLVATRLLAPAVAVFRRRHPGVRLTIDGDDRAVSLALGEADVAIRLARPQAEEALARRLGHLAFGFYGPRGDDGVGELPSAGYGDGLAHLPESRWLAANRPGSSCSFRSNRIGAIAEAIAAGHRGVLPFVVGGADARLTRLSGTEPIVTREVWLLARTERRHEAAVAAAIDWITATMRPHLIVSRGPIWPSAEEGHQEVGMERGPAVEAGDAEDGTGEAEGPGEAEQPTHPGQSRDREHRQ